MKLMSLKIYLKHPKLNLKNHLGNLSSFFSTEIMFKLDQHAFSAKNANSSSTTIFISFITRCHFSWFFHIIQSKSLSSLQMMLSFEMYKAIFYNLIRQHHVTYL